VSLSPCLGEEGLSGRIAAEVAHSAQPWAQICATPVALMLASADPGFG
jgi:hypothetical protein